MTKKFFQVPTLDVAKYWNSFEPVLNKAILRGADNTLTIEGCFQRLVNNFWQLFIVIDNDELELAFVTQVIPSDVCNSLCVVYIASYEGKEADLEYLQTCLEHVAKNYNCKKIMGGGRKAWRRKLKTLGYKEIVFMEKEL